MTENRRARWTAGAVILLAAACARAAPRVDAIAADAARQEGKFSATYSVSAPNLLPERLTLPLEQHSDLFFAKARVDGREVGEFLVDTGSDMTFIDRALADELGLPELVDVQVGGVHQSAKASLCTLDQLTIGGLRLDSTATLALPLDDLSARTGRRVAGIIGFPTIGATPFTIDFAAATLTIYNPERFEPPANVTSELLRIHEYSPFVEATLEKDDVVWLLLDSGSGAAITLWDRFVNEHPDVLSPRKRWALSTGVGGGTQVMMSEARSLRLFGQEFPNVTAIVQEAPPQAWAHPRAAGILGLEVLRQLRVTIDPVKRRIWAERADPLHAQAAFPHDIEHPL